MRTIINRVPIEIRLQRLQEGQESACDARAHAILQRDLLNEEIETLNRDIDEYGRLIERLKAQTSHPLNPIGK